MVDLVEERKDGSLINSHSEVGIYQTQALAKIDWQEHFALIAR